jgi:hypothetical protein
MKQKVILKKKIYNRRVGPGRKSNKPFAFAFLHMKDIGVLFDLNVTTISKWDCPRNSNGTYNAVAVVRWRMDKIKEELKPSSMNGLETQKLKLQCEKLEFDLDERKKNSITIDEMKAKMTEAMLAFKGYFTDYGKLNLHLVANQPIETLRKYWNELVKLGLNHFAGAAESK